METIDYNSFAKKCVDDLKSLQDRFQEEYDLNWYENWFYNQATGLLTFSSNEVELNFKYFEVGSFSEKLNTWMWSWDNDDTLDNVKEKTKLIKRFGQRSNFSRLTNGCFQSDEFEAWEFTAIATKVTNGIGVYRPVNHEQLQIFLVITEFVDNEVAQNIKDKYVQCDIHEYKRIAFVCQHLNHTSKIGFEEAFETSEDMELMEEEDFQAWCNECEVVRLKEGEWNDKSMEFSGIKLVCEKCYFEMKELNLGHR
ncbi:hypothetical protein GM921_07820 [Pedobacter sp. LMG 31464]|uniref:Uncharacterized protein n=1 Tax=Pedobacter planticolens TaxID=2679964 RepID=A0A923DWP6_9SPHI|nr:DUF6882 domain-containing protein [Pedobacter planticolens]MBB2145386.1 hypothetical protein [Pedobacter planticolens]